MVSYLLLYQKENKHGSYVAGLGSTKADHSHTSHCSDILLIVPAIVSVLGKYFPDASQAVDCTIFSKSSTIFHAFLIVP